MALKASTMRTLREWHLYMGLFFAPLLLLFSISGAFQTFRIPDQPSSPTWMKWIAAIHKDQAPPHERRPNKPPIFEAKGGKADGNAPGAPKPGGPKMAKHDKLPLQILVVLLSIALFLSTVSGIVIALNSRATRRASLILLSLGTLLPILLFYL